MYAAYSVQNGEIPRPQTARGRRAFEEGACILYATGAKTHHMRVERVDFGETSQAGYARLTALAATDAVAEEGELEVAEGDEDAEGEVTGTADERAEDGGKGKGKARE
jgi:hypothetical protein